ncbi:MAG: hypothetical protein U0V18_01760 [Anaerolineales bacterium]
MNLDIETIKNTISAFGAALTVLKQAKDMLPESTQKQDLNIAIESAERQLKIAEIKTAQVMGHEICKNHWPSGIMFSSDNKKWECPICGNTIDKSKIPEITTNLPNLSDL